MEERGKEIFEELQEKQARLAKKILLATFCAIGFVFAILGIVFIDLNEVFKLIALVFLPMGIGFIALGIILYFVIPTKYDYDKYKARVEKYGMMNAFDMNAKVAELEARIEELERRI